MRKTFAYFLGVFLVFTLGYLLLHPAFLLIADWLGPLFGSPLLVALMSAFLLFGDPLRFAVLSALWGGVALLGGLIIRRRVGAVATMVAVFLFFLSVLAASVLNIVQTVQAPELMGGQQSPLSLLPPFPKGMSLARLVEAPIIGRLIDPILGLVEAGRPEGARELVMGVVTPLLIDFAEKIVIICLAALVGAEVGRRVEDRFTPWSESLRIKLGGKPRPGLSSGVSAARRVVPLTILILILLSVGVSAVPPRAASRGGYFSENLIGFVDDDGGGYVAALFLDSDMSVGGFDMGSPEVEGLLATALVSQDSILDAIPDIEYMPKGFDIGSIQSLMPPTALVMVYVDVPPEVAEERAGVISSAFSDAFGIGLRQLIAFSPPLPEEGVEEMPQVSIVVYQSSDELGGMAEAYLNLFPVERGGLAEVMAEAHRNGRLTPEAIPGSPDGAVLFAGFINLATAGRYLPLEELDRLNVSRPILPSFDATLGFSGGVSYWESGVQSPPDAHSFDILRLFGVESPVSFSSEADFSNLILVAPNRTLEAGDEGPGRAIKLVTTAPLTDPQFGQMIQELARWITVTVMSPGSLLDPSHFRVDFSALLPLNVQVSKQVTPQATSTNGEVQVTVTVENSDDYPMENVVLDDGGTVLGYPTSVSVTSGSTRETWSALQPGESRTLTYTLRLGPGGVYTLRPATVQYVYEEETFSASSDPAEVRVSHPSALAFVIDGVAATWASTARALDTFTGGNGSILLMASTLAWVVVLAFMEYRGFRKWLSGE